MALGLDYIHEISVADLQAAKVTDVFRYLSWLPNSLNKVITPNEYHRLTNGGIICRLNWEFDEKDWLGGTAKGTEHAAEAVRQAKLCGYPRHGAIIGSADFDMTLTQWNSVGHSYAQAFATGIRAGGYTPGVYGPWDVLGWCENVMDWFWQSMSTAYSNKRNANKHPLTNWWQKGYKTVANQNCDWSQIITLSSVTGGNDVSVKTDNIVAALADGQPHGAGGEVIAPVDWRIRDEAWQASVNSALASQAAALAALSAKVSTPVTVELSDAQLLAAIKAALREGVGQ